MKTLIKAKETEKGIIAKFRDDNDKTYFKTIPFLNWVYVKNSDVDLIPDSAYQYISEIVRDNPFNGYSAIYLNNNFDRRLLNFRLMQEGITVYENDINAVKRFLITNQTFNLNPSNLKYVFYDIETKDDGILKTDDKGYIIAERPILSIAYKDYNGKTLFLKNNDQEDILKGEAELLRSHKRIIEQYDICLAWNGYKFDDAYIKQRNIFHNISNEYLEFINLLDYMEIVNKNIRDLESYSLEYVSQKFLNEGKKDIGDKGRGVIYKSWLDSFEGDDKLQQYNEQDVNLMYKLEKKLNLLNIHKKEAEIGHCFIQDTLHNSDICDYIILNKFYQRGEISPSKPSRIERENRKKDRVLGAEVFCESPGIYDNVFVFDFKSFYPSTIAMCNICVTTLLHEHEDDCITIPANTMIKNGERIKVSEKYFSTKKQGIISEIAKWLIETRDKKKYEKFKYINSDPDKYKELQLFEKAIKNVANSLYGALAFNNFRYYNYEVASAITQFCREIINRSKQFAEQEGYKVIQGDTDSLMFIGDNHEILENKFKQKFDEWSKEMGIKNHLIKFEWEKTFHRMISVKKKNYAALSEIIDDKEKSTGKFEINITGLECVRRDTNPLGKELQFELIEDVLYNRFNKRKFLNKIDKIINELNNKTIDYKYLIMSNRLTKQLNEYGKDVIDSKTGDKKITKDGKVQVAAIPAYVKLAKRLMAEGKEIFIGDNITYIVKTSKPVIEAITVEEYLKTLEFDKNYYWQRIIKPVIKVLNVCYPDVVDEIEEREDKLKYKIDFQSVNW